jgi:lipoyl(octanoyl) transferase
MINLIDWGITRYEYALNLQKKLVKKRISMEIPDTLIITEHYPVFTIKSQKLHKKLILWDNDMLKKNNIEVQRTNRGGKVTYHAPGQIILYPIIHLKYYKVLYYYLRTLEKIIIKTLLKFKINSHRRKKKTGVWVENQKIASIGLAIKNFVAYHGVSLNVDLDLYPFEGIVPCGISKKNGGITSMKELMESKVKKNKVKMIMVKNFKFFFRRFKNSFLV